MLVLLIYKNLKSDYLLAFFPTILTYRRWAVLTAIAIFLIPWATSSLFTNTSFIVCTSTIVWARFRVCPRLLPLHLGKLLGECPVDSVKAASWKWGSCYGRLGSSWVLWVMRGSWLVLIRGSGSHIILCAHSGIVVLEGIHKFLLLLPCFFAKLRRLSSNSFHQVLNFQESADSE